MAAPKADPNTWPWPKKGMSQPAHRALMNAGYTTLEQLNGVSESELAKLHGMGPKALRVLQSALAEKGMTFSK